MSDSLRQNREGLSGLGFWIALGLVASSFVLKLGLVEIKSQNNEITVKGYAEKPIESDLAVWSANITARGGQLEAAYAKLEADRTRLLQFLEKSGVTDLMVHVDPVWTTAVYENLSNGMRGNRIVGYELGQSVQLSSRDLDLVERVARSSADLIRDGVELSASPPQFHFTKLDTLKVEMLGEASRDAAQRARVLAENGGGKVGALRYASQGVFQITPEFSTEVSPYGMNDTSSRQKSIKAVVTVRYAIGR
jgi:hypothetical protein